MSEYTEQDFRQQYLGDFKPDERYTALCERLNQYYKDTPDSMDNRQALPYWKAFTQWCFNNGYTPEEINKAKRDCLMSLEVEK